MTRNIIQNIHPVTDNYRGENYWFCGCAAYVMEALAPIPRIEPNAPADPAKPSTEYNYSLFAGVTGDNFTQIWPLDARFAGECASEFLTDAAYVTDVFDKIGYEAEYVADKSQFAQRVVESIDRGVPVICWGRTGDYPTGWTVVGGYEDNGGTLLQMPTANRGADKIAASDAVSLTFVKGRTRVVPLARVYREAIERLPGLLSTRTDSYVFGADAFREWANHIERGGYDGVDLKGNWNDYTNYVCVLATNGSCCHSFLRKAMELNPDMAFLSKISALYQRTADMWNKDRDCLEALGGGFNITSETMSDPVKRSRITAKLRGFAEVIDEALLTLRENLVVC
jgi:hypothetical protein